jgi:hypothetical protein
VGSDYDLPVKEGECGRHAIRPRWERFGFVIGLLIALAIMWGVVAIALVAGDDNKGSNNRSVIYEKQDSQPAPDEDR